MKKLKQSARQWSQPLAIKFNSSIDFRFMAKGQLWKTRFEYVEYVDAKGFSLTFAGFAFTRLESSSSPEYSPWPKFV